MRGVRIFCFVLLHFLCFTLALLYVCMCVICDVTRVMYLPRAPSAPSHEAPSAAPDLSVPAEGFHGGRYYVIAPKTFPECRRDQRHGET